MIFRKDKKMRNKKKIKGLIKNILISALRVIIVTLNAEINMDIDFSKIIRRMSIEILFELLLYINSKSWRHFDIASIIM